MDWCTTASSPQSFYTAGATLVAKVTQAPDPNSTSLGPLSLFPNLDQFSDPTNFLGSPSEGAAEETRLSTSAQLAPLQRNLVIILAVSEATGNLDPESPVETSDAPMTEMEVSPTSTSNAQFQFLHHQQSLGWMRPFGQSRELLMTPPLLHLLCFQPPYLRPPHLCPRSIFILSHPVL